MDLDAILKKIIDRFDREYRGSDRVRALEKIISEGADHYKYAEEMAREVGRLLNDALREYLPEALTNDMLYRATADVVLKRPMLNAAAHVGDAASAVQKNINQKAGIGINPIAPDVNEDQINGIITGICNAESYDSGKETLFDQTENFLEGYVDDHVQTNAGFQYEAGLDPTVTRTATSKCCKWCEQLAGTYDYEKVRNKGNDIWRRHKNCHCIIDYNPGEDSKWRQNVRARGRVYSEKEEMRERRLHYGTLENAERGNKKLKVRAINNYGINNLYVDDRLDLSPREVRWINTQITQAKDLHDVSDVCKSKFIITIDNDDLAAYNPTTDEFFISSRLADKRNMTSLQQGYACPDDPRSTLVHEIFHWKDAEEYRNTIGTIVSASKTSEYTLFQRDKGRMELQRAGVDLSDLNGIRLNISGYAEHVLSVDNDTEEAYTEYRTKLLIEKGIK